jgi:hypothetical protein
MSFKRFPIRDPRTVARDIPGILDSIFPQLNAGLVAHLNKQAVTFPRIGAISDVALEESKLRRPMLFELAVARTEQLLSGKSVANWEECLSVASSRQRRHFDAKIPGTLAPVDMSLAEAAALNLFEMLSQISRGDPEHELKISPEVPGYSWIASGNVDFSFGPLLIEVKHTATNYSAADFRQVLMYWLLSYASSIEKGGTEFSDCILLNPRRNSGLAFKFSLVVQLASSGLGKLEVLRLFDSILGDSALKIQQII